MKTVNLLYEEIYDDEQFDLQSEDQLIQVFKLYPDKIIDTIIFLCDRIDKLNDKVEKAIEKSKEHSNYTILDNKYP